MTPPTGWSQILYGPDRHLWWVVGPVQQQVGGIERQEEEEERAEYCIRVRERNLGCDTDLNPRICPKLAVCPWAHHLPFLSLNVVTCNMWTNTSPPSLL